MHRWRYGWQYLTAPHDGSMKQNTGISLRESMRATKQVGFAEGWILGGKGRQNNNNINNNTKIKTLPYFSLHKASCSKHISQLTLSKGTLGCNSYICKSNSEFYFESYVDLKLKKKGCEKISNNDKLSKYIHFTPYIIECSSKPHDFEILVKIKSISFGG